MKNNNAMRGLVLFLGILAAVMLLAFLTGDPLTKQAEELSYSQFIQKVQEGSVDRIVLQERTVVGLYANSQIGENRFPKAYDFSTTVPSTDDLMSDLRTIAAEKTGKPVEQVTSADLTIGLETPPPQQESWWSILLPYLILATLMGGMLFLFMRQMQGTNNKAMSFGKSKARLADDKNKVTFVDVAGADEEKEELAEIVEYLKNPRKFMELGARIPKGVLLVGPPGTGKTLLAKAVAGEAGVPFYSISGSDFVEMYVGVGASRVRDLFEQAKRTSPSIVFIDEIDAVGRQRGAGMGGGHDEREQTLNQLLVEMDGFSVNEGIIIIAATNRPDILDPALLRPGRFDRQVTVNYPDVKGREEILKVHARGKPLSADVKLDVLAKITPYFTGADLENVLNEAALLAARRGQSEITMRNVTEAINRVELGPEKRSHKVTERDRKLVAYHESGHALVAQMLPNCDPVHEISIIPRGQAGGYTQTQPTEETNFITRASILDRITMAMGGYAAEDLIMGDVTTGSSSDLKNASQLARRMVTEWGMSDEVGPLYLSAGQEVFLGRDFGHTNSLSESLNAKVDGEVRRIVENALTRAKDILRQNADKLKTVAEALLEQEKLSGEEFEQILGVHREPPRLEASEESWSYERPEPPQPSELSDAPPPRVDSNPEPQV